MNEIITKKAKPREELFLGRGKKGVQNSAHLFPSAGSRIKFVYQQFLLAIHSPLGMKRATQLHEEESKIDSVMDNLLEDPEVERVPAIQAKGHDHVTTSSFVCLQSVQRMLDQNCRPEWS